MLRAYGGNQILPRILLSIWFINYLFITRLHINMHESQNWVVKLSQIRSTLFIIYYNNLKVGRSRIFRVHIYFILRYTFHQETGRGWQHALFDARDGTRRLHIVTLLSFMRRDSSKTVMTCEPLYPSYYFQNAIVSYHRRDNN